MRLLSVRLIVSLIIGITLVSSGFSYYEVLAQKRALRADVERRDEVLGESLAGNVTALWNPASDTTTSASLASSTPNAPSRAPERVPEKAPNEEAPSKASLQQLVQRFGNRERLLGVGVYDRQGVVVAITPDLANALSPSPPEITKAIGQAREDSSFVKLGSVPVHILALPFRRQNQSEALGSLVLVHDVSYIHEQILLVWRQTFFRVLAQVFLIVLITLLIIRWSMVGPIARAALWMRGLRTGKISFRQGLPDLDMFRPLAREVATMAESLNHARHAAENEARLRDAGASLWTADRLSVQLRTRLDGGKLVVVSNREPYMHERNGKTIDVVVPPSGIVTALEPVLNACDGTWIAHGSGSADAEVVDSGDCLRVPPDDPRYTLRRVWLTKDEEEGYYYGFANEGLWPLCHVAHTRPLFRATDWQTYQDVNRKFTNVVLEESRMSRSPWCSSRIITSPCSRVSSRRSVPMPE